jgi:hypothetical protein
MSSPFRLTFALNPSRRKSARVTLALGGGLFKGGNEPELSRAVLQVMLDCLFQIDVLYLRAHPETPRLYESGVKYMEEPPGQEDWQDIPTCLKYGVADCDDLGPWRAAELVVKDRIQARPVCKAFPRPDGSTLYHIIVERADRREPEDPSLILGMR